MIVGANQNNVLVVVAFEDRRHVDALFLQRRRVFAKFRQRCLVLLRRVALRQVHDPISGIAVCLFKAGPRRLGHLSAASGRAGGKVVLVVAHQGALDGVVEDLTRKICKATHPLDMSTICGSRE